MFAEQPDINSLAITNEPGSIATVNSARIPPVGIMPQAYRVPVRQIPTYDTGSGLGNLQISPGFLLAAAAATLVMSKKARKLVGLKV